MQIHKQSHSPSESVSALRAALKIDDLDCELFVGLRPVAPTLVKQITTRIQSEVTSYAGPQTGRRHTLILMAVSQAVSQFCAALENRPHSEIDVERLFRQMGHGEAVEGHSLDAMRAAYQIATRESWAFMQQLAATQAMPHTLLAPLTQALFIYMQQLTEQVTVGYLAGSRQSGDDQTAARRKLLDRLLDGRSREPIDDLAESAGWPLPAEVVVIRVELDVRRRLADLSLQLPGIAPPVLIRDDINSLTAIADNTRSTSLPQDFLRLPGSQRVARSWPVPVEQARHASLWVRRALRLAVQGQIDDRGIVECADHRALLWMHADPVLMQHTSTELLEPLRGEKPHSKTVLAETLLLWLQTHASAPKLAEQLGVHEQTVRQRMRRLKDLFGNQLTDPSQSLALLMALRQAADQNSSAEKNTHTHDN